MRLGADFPENWAIKLQALHCLGVGKNYLGVQNTVYYCILSDYPLLQKKLKLPLCGVREFYCQRESLVTCDMNSGYKKCLVFNLVLFFPEPLFHLKASSCVITQVPLCEPMLSCGGAQSISRFSSNSKFGLKLPHPLPH